VSYKLVVTDDTPLFSAEAAKQLAALPAAVKSVVQLGAAYERQNHEYRNRTGALERTTIGRLERRTASDIRAELTMKQPYASYVVARGFSEIQTAANNVEAALVDLLDTHFTTR
jgi:hypothetical protein